MEEKKCESCISFRVGDDEMFGDCRLKSEQVHAANCCESFVSIEEDWRCSRCRNQFREDEKVCWNNGYILWRDNRNRNMATRCSCRIAKEKYLKENVEEKTSYKNRGFFRKKEKSIVVLKKNVPEVTEWNASEF